MIMIMEAVEVVEVVEAMVPTEEMAGMDLEMATEEMAAMLNQVVMAMEEMAEVAV